MFSWPSSSLLRLLVVQIFLVAVSQAYPSSYMIVPAGDQPVSVHKRAFDRLEGADFGFWSKRALVKRAFDRLEGTDFGFRRKRAFDRIARNDFGLRKKRSFDRISGTSFGLNKRSIPEQREDLVNELTASIIALRQAREAEQTDLTTSPLVVLEPLEN